MHMLVGATGGVNNQGGKGMTAVQDPTVQRRKLRLELRKARSNANKTQADVAEAMDWSPSKLIRIERGDVGISSNDLKALLNYYGVDNQDQIGELVELARSARGASAYDAFTDLLKPGFAEYLAYESSASVIRQYDPVVVPGLLQIEEYARGLFEGEGRFDPEKSDRLWKLRVQRQKVHDRDNRPKLQVVLDEAALRRHVGGRRVMIRQLEHLRDFAAAPYIDLRILPFARGAHPGLLGNFILLEFADTSLDDLVHLEHINQITIRDDTELIAQYTDRFKYLQDISLSLEKSVDFIDVIIKDMHTDSSKKYSSREVV
jgi:transcriptional regulator with XRE-family HTH domain